MTARQGVAISTTGDEHRLPFLETAVAHWDAVLNFGDVLFVTVDGDEHATERVADAVSRWTGSVFRVGQRPGVPPFDTRHGVAVNKNTGLELLMSDGRVEHLFLSDDDTYPLGRSALRKHTRLAEDGVPHSMVCWGQSRYQESRDGYSTWSWPRGVVLHATRAVVQQVGGFIEEFGSGAHEHAEWSRRIHQHDLTPAPYVTPLVYSLRGVAGPATRAGQFWHCEDMKVLGETSHDLGLRRSRITSLRKAERDWPHIEALMASLDGNTDFVPFCGRDNGRGSATLFPTSTGLGAGGEQ